MKRSRLLLALIVLASITCRSREQAVAELQSRITNETARLETQLISIDRSKLPEDVAGLLNGYRDAFARVRNTTPAPLRLYRLRDLFIGTESLSFFAANRDAADSIESLNALVASRRAAYDAQRAPPAGADAVRHRGSACEEKRLETLHVI